MPMVTQNMLQELLAESPDPQTSCEQIDMENLLAYIEAEFAERDADQLYPYVRTALNQSPVCQQAYAAMKEFLRQERSEEWRKPPRSPTFDFSYLSASASPSLITVQPWRWWTALGRLIIEFSEEIIQKLHSVQPQPTYTFQRSASAPSEAYRLALESVVEDLNIQVSIQPERQGANSYTLIVETDIPSRGGWPNLTNTQVVLKLDNAVIQTRLTDAFGKAVFDPLADVQLAQLQVEVMPEPPADPGHQSG